MATHTMTEPQPGPRQAAYLAAPPRAMQPANQAATRIPATGGPQAAAWPQGSAAPYPPAPGWSTRPPQRGPAFPGRCSPR